MIEFLNTIDQAIFHFINTTLANPLFDACMPAITDWNKSWVGLSIFGGFWLFIVLAGGKKGRIVGGMLVLLILFSDQLSSSILKPLFARPRPCHVMIEQVRLLVDCGSGYSFPSSHAVNNAAFGVFMSYYYRRLTWAFASYAFIMCLSRVVVGVHYPSDVLGGAVIGAASASGFVYAQFALGRMFPAFNLTAAANKPHDPPDSTEEG